MEGIFSNLYLVLQAKLKGITVAEQSVLKMVTEDTGQLLDEVPALEYPCMLINFDDTQYTSIGDNCKIGVVNICLQLVLDVYSSTADIVPLASKEKGLSYLAVESKVHKALQGWSPSDELVPVTTDPAESQPDGWSDIYGSMDHVSSKPNKQHEKLRIRELIYSLGFDDYSTASVITYIAAPPAITASFVTAEIDPGITSELSL